VESVEKSSCTIPKKTGEKRGKGTPGPREYKKRTAPRGKEVRLSKKGKTMVGLRLGEVLRVTKTNDTCILGASTAMKLRRKRPGEGVDLGDEIKGEKKSQLRSSLGAVGRVNKPKKIPLFWEGEGGGIKKRDSAGEKGNTPTSVTGSGRKRGRRSPSKRLQCPKKRGVGLQRHNKGNSVGGEKGNLGGTGGRKGSCQSKIHCWWKDRGGKSKCPGMKTGVPENGFGGGKPSSSEMERRDGADPGIVQRAFEQEVDRKVLARP